MSWEIFRCNLATKTDNCTDKSSTMCISEALYQGQADAMVSQGFAAAGYASIHMDDCWEEKHPPRDPTTGELVADAVRFPSGMKALGDYVHSKGLSFAIYTAESTETCGGYPASANHEELDAKTFASWGVDYIKGSCLLFGWFFSRLAVDLVRSPHSLSLPHTFLTTLQWMAVETTVTIPTVTLPWEQPLRPLAAPLCTLALGLHT